MDELLSLLETAPPTGNARIAPEFSDVQLVVWTGDESYPGRAWSVNFGKTTTTLWDILKTRVGWVRPVAAAAGERRQGRQG